MRLNRRFNLIPISIVLFSLFLVACSTQQSEEEFTESAKRLVEESAFSQLEITAKNFLAKNPDSAIARSFLVRSLVGGGNYTEAINQWNRIDNPKKDILELSLDDVLEAQYFLGTYEEAASLLSDNNIESPSKRLSLLTFLTKLKTLSNEEVIALDISSIFTDPDSQYASLGKAMIDTFTNEGSTALKSFFEQNSNDSSAIFQSIAADHFSFLKEYSVAESYLERYLSLRPNHHIAYLSFINTLILQEKVDRANLELKDILSKFPNQPLANQQMAKIALMQDNLPLAKVHIERSIQYGFNTRNNHLVAGLINYNLNNYEQAISNLERALSNMQEYSEYSLILNYAKARVGADKDSVLQPADKVIQELSDIKKINSLLGGYRDSGNTEELASTLRDLSTNSPDTKVAFDLAVKQAAVSIEDSSEMFSLAKDIVENKGSVDSLAYDKAKVLHTSKLVNEGKLTQAISIAEKWLNESNYAFMDVLLYSDLLVRDGQYAKANATLDKGLTVTIHPVFYSRQVNIEFAQKNYKAAHALSEKALTLMPYSFNYLSQYAALNQIVKSGDDVFIESIYEDYETNGLSLIYLSEYFREIDNNQKSIKLLQEGKPKFPQLSSQIVLLSAENYLALGDIDAVNMQLSELSKLELQDIKLYPRYARLFKASVDQNLVLDILKGVIRKYPAFLPAKNQLAWQYVTSGNNSEAITLLEGLQNVDSPEPGRILGLAQRNSGKIKTASEIWSKNYQNYQDPESLMLLSELYFQLGEKDRASQLINSHLIKEPNHIGLKLLLAGNVDTAKAKDLYRQVLSIDANNIFALTNLAWVIFNDEGKNQEAIELIEQARNIAPDNQNVQATYNSILE
ncbi:hypothetical protein [Glaciecola petra]|uniref:Uncharacterized protein n=1 Tax=Glaciecola petra TaxID=3075602 RepID=A0ABU2ZLW7_9ALTE|nr:hypothetical protein [Aestuariibacter sp. P117]MDT0593620.1 hypothetical protein [Aestuariibacter sp. P117]